MLVLFVLLVHLYILFVLVVFVDIICHTGIDLLMNRILTEPPFRLKNKFVYASFYWSISKRPFLVLKFQFPSRV